MRKINALFLLFACLNWVPLAAFLGWLTYREVRTGDPETGRLYFTDIVVELESSSTTLIGVMTTFSYTWLVLAGVCAAVLSHIRRRQGNETQAIRFWSCAAVVFVLAGLDERFSWHEAAGLLLGINDTLIVAIYPLLAVLAAWGARSEIAKFRKNGWLLAPVVLGTLVTLGADAVGGERPFRLLVEDGSKVIAASSLFLLVLKCLFDDLDCLILRPRASEPLD